MAFFDFDFIENFFFVSLGITFALIILLVYHFKQRISSMERKGDTMYELITNVVKELQFMKKLNAYYETLFQNTTSPKENSPLSFEEKSSSIISQTPTQVVPPGFGVLTDSCLVEEISTDNIVLQLVERTPSVEGSSLKDKPELLANSRIVVSDDESSVSDNESDSDDTDLNYSSDDEDSDDDDNDDNDDTDNNGEDLSSKVLKSVENNEPVQQFTFCEDKTPNVVSSGISQTPVEMNNLMEMINKAFANGISPQEPQKFAPYYEPELEEPTSYKPVVIHDKEQIIDEPLSFEDLSSPDDGEFSQQPEETLDNSVIEKEPIVVRTPEQGGIDCALATAKGVSGWCFKTPSGRTGDGLPSKVIDENTFSVEDKSSSVEQFTDETPNVISSGIPQFTDETPNVISSGIPQFTDETPNVISSGIPQIQSPVLPIDKKQTREVYRKMNITQLRGIAPAAGITIDTTKMKKNELIQLLENLEE